MTTTSDTMDEATFRALSAEVISRVQRALDAEDPDVVEAVLDAEVLKIAFPTGQPFVLNMQRPVREMWLAADRQAWHFRYDGARWVDKKGDAKSERAELFSTLTALVGKKTGLSLVL